jgi:hypothetical protein
MTWASQRRLVVFVVIGAILAVLAAGMYLTVFYRAPVCTDGLENGSETGPDCGGSCPYLCNADAEEPTVLFTQAILNGAGRTDVIALVENKNQDAAAKEVPYDLSVFGYDQALIQRVSGTLDLPPGASVPVFLPGISSGHAIPGAAFLSIASTSVKWYALPEDPRIIPSVSNTVLSDALTSPRITATLANPDVRAMRHIKVVAIVRDASGNAIAASQTIIPTIRAQSSATATFTWNAPFTDTAVQIQVLPVVPLPAGGQDLP